MKKNFSLNEYVASIPFNEFDKLTSQLSERYPGDLAYCLDYFSKNEILDNMLSKTSTADEIYDILDNMSSLLNTRFNKIKEKELVSSKK